MGGSWYNKEFEFGIGIIGSKWDMIPGGHCWAHGPGMQWSHGSIFENQKSCIYMTLTHWGRVTHIYVSKLTIIGSDNGLSPGRRQATIWTNGGILLIGPLGTNFREILIEIQSFSFKKTHLKMSSGKWRPFCLGLNVLRKGKVIVVLHAKWLVCWGITYGHMRFSEIWPSDVIWHHKFGVKCQHRSG